MSDRPSYVDDWMQKQSPADVTVDISVVIPAYNEERRLPPTLIDMIDYFDDRQISYELIVVDDGSSDNTVEVVKKFEKIRPHVKLIRVPSNHGKGYAVRTGMLNSRGRFILFADADGATPIAETERLEAALNAGADVAIGSRAKASDETKVSTQWYKKLRGRAFNFLVNFLCVPKLEDTQCGFKMFTAPASKFLFERQTAEGFSFDVEILFLADSAGMKVAEIPVNWTNIPGSKVHPILDPLRMLKDLFIFRYRHRGIEKGAFSRS